MMKYCTRCKKQKPVSCFYKNKARKDGFCGHCKSCENTYARERGKKPEVRAQESLRRKKRLQVPGVREQRNLRMKLYRQRPDVKISKKNYRLKQLYGITLEQYNQMFAKQNGFCAICGKKETTKNQYNLRQLAVDHNHATGQVRGLLCSNCNLLLGCSKDNKEILLKAILYLESKGEKINVN